MAALFSVFTKPFLFQDMSLFFKSKMAFHMDNFLNFFFPMILYSPSGILIILYWITLINLPFCLTSPHQSSLDLFSLNSRKNSQMNFQPNSLIWFYALSNLFFRASIAFLILAIVFSSENSLSWYQIIPLSCLQCVIDSPGVLDSIQIFWFIWIKLLQELPEESCLSGIFLHII